MNSVAMISAYDVLYSYAVTALSCAEGVENNLYFVSDLTCSSPRVVPITRTVDNTGYDREHNM